MTHASSGDLSRLSHEQLVESVVSGLGLPGDVSTEDVPAASGSAYTRSPHVRPVHIASYPKRRPVPFRSATHDRQRVVRDVVPIDIREPRYCDFISTPEVVEVAAVDTAETA